MATAIQSMSLRVSLITRSLSDYCPWRFVIPLSCHRRSLTYSFHRRVVELNSSPPVLNRSSYRCLCRASDSVEVDAREENEDVADDKEGNIREEKVCAIDDFEGYTWEENDYGKFTETGVAAAEGHRNFLELSDKELFIQCKMDTYRASGPGGQHRNKTESAVRLKHLPTGLVSQAVDDRSQHVNRALALNRLRQLIAVEVRSPVELEGYKAPPELVRILPSGAARGKDKSVQKIGPNHPDFALGVKALLDLFSTYGGSVADTATALGLSTGLLSKVITSDKILWQGANKIRASKGLKPLR